jgi:hypothetical protein
MKIIKFKLTKIKCNKNNYKFVCFFYVYLFNLMYEIVIIILILKQTMFCKKKKCIWKMI